jgi:ribosomal protein S18 acetylase RimI-like enzyme
MSAETRARQLRPWVRPYRAHDLAAVYDVCVRTANAGEDARGKYQSDALMPDIFAGPYVHLEPDLAFVLDNGRRAVGYVVGTADTAAFVRVYRQRWIPRLADRYATPPDPPVSGDDHMLALHYAPERMLVPELDDHPAHLHIDVLPAYQRRGHGRKLITTFLAAAAAAGAPAVHVGVDVRNTRAISFYRKLGFADIPVPGATSVRYLGRATA